MYVAKQELKRKCVSIKAVWMEGTFSRVRFALIFAADRYRNVYLAGNTVVISPKSILNRVTGLSESSPLGQFFK
jgi:hypothetical protein